MKLEGVAKRALTKRMGEILDEARSYGPLQALRYACGPLDYRIGADGETEVRPQSVGDFLGSDSG